MPAPGEKKRPPCEPITAIGVIIPVAWDDRGNPTAVAIATYNENEYLIDGANPMGQALQAAIHRKVQVRGTLGKKRRKRPMLTVESFEQL